MVVIANRTFAVAEEITKTTNRKKVLIQVANNMVPLSKQGVGLQCWIRKAHNLMYYLSDI